MSRGPGRIERAIRALFDAHPDLAFTTDELAEHCYPRTATIERKHQVSVLRAAGKVIAGDRDWYAWRIDGQGRGWVFVNGCNLQSYALGRLIADVLTFYGSKKRVERYSPGAMPADRKNLLARLEPGGKNHDSIQPGGGWYRHVQLHIAERDGDTNAIAHWQAKQDAAMAALDAKCFYAERPIGKESLTQNPPFNQSVLAERIRGISAQNDPDVVRAGLSAIAAELERGAVP
jgi:hypothetical protein